MQRLLTIIVILSLFNAASLTHAYAQSAQGYDATLPVKVRADSFFVNRREGRAEFSGGVVITQGEMVMSADVVLVEYVVGARLENRSVDKLTATGDVDVLNGSQSARAQMAVYSVQEGSLVLTGSAEVTQNESVIAGEKITLNLADDTLFVEGRVQTVFEFTPLATKE
jgi:lipopolysaccharide export system protein LptA